MQMAVDRLNHDVVQFDVGVLGVLVTVLSPAPIGVG